MYLVIWGGDAVRKIFLGFFSFFPRSMLCLKKFSRKNLHMSITFCIFVFMFDPDALFPAVSKDEIENLIDCHITDELDRIRECVAPYEPFNTVD